jgi:putative lipoic acid-binding regulatory protein
MGRDCAQFRTAARAIVERHIGPLPETVVSSRASSEGNFLAITFAITAESRAQLDALYEELSSCPEILVAL